jgi:uncharacterized Fe-S cluster protein YjdI
MARRRVQRYEAEGIAVTFDPNLCIHTARCLQGLPAVFDVGRRDWVRPAEADANEVAAVIRRCPSGALQYELAAGPPEAGDEPATVRPQPNGPLHVRGEVTLLEGEGGLLATGTRFTLCRCGHSRNKPFCDNSHREAGFRAP